MSGKDDFQADNVIQRATAGVRPPPPPPADAMNEAGLPFRELQVQQAEWQVLNEELQRTRTEAESLLAKYASLYDGAPVGYFTLNRDGLILEANMTGARLLELAKDALPGQPFHRFVAPEFQASFLLHHQNVMARGRHHACELQLVSAAGRSFFAALECTGQRDETGEVSRRLTIVADITERKRLEDEIQASEKRYRHIVEDQVEFICRYQRDGTITFVNRALCLLVGGRREDLAGRNVFLIPVAADQQLLREAVALLDAARPSVTCEYRVFVPGGDPVWQQWTHRIIYNRKGALVEYQAVGRDITVLKETEAVLRQARDDLERTVRERTAELAAESRRLAEMNAALKVLLQQRESDRQEMELKVLDNIRILILPLVEKLQATPLSPHQHDYLQLITHRLQDVASPFLHTLAAARLQFTPREIEVAHLVREGKTTKEIAVLLNMSIRSAEFHRDNIRKKLGLIHRPVTLRSHLLSLL